MDPEKFYGYEYEYTVHNVNDDPIENTCKIIKILN